MLPGIVLSWTELQYPGGQSYPMQPATSLSGGKGEGSLLSSSKKLFLHLQDKERESTAFQESDACLDIPVDEQLVTAVQESYGV